MQPWSTHRGECLQPLLMQLPLWPVLHTSRQPIPPPQLNGLHPGQGHRGVEGITSRALLKEENGKGHIRRRGNTTTTPNPPTTPTTTTTTTPTPDQMAIALTNTIVMVNPPAPSAGRVVEGTQHMSAGSQIAPGASLQPTRWRVVQKPRTVGPAVGPHTRTSSSILCGSSTSVKEPSVQG